MRILMVGAVALWGAMGCGGTETGNASEGVPLTFSLRLEGAHPAGVEISAGTARVRRVDFDLPAGMTCEDARPFLSGGVCDLERIRFTGPWVVDLVSGVAEPALEGLTLPAGRYRRVDVRLQDDDDTLRVSGEAEGRGFILRSDQTLDARFEGDLAVVAGEGAVGVALSLPVASWFAGAPLAECLAGAAEEPVLIDEDAGGRCEDVLDAVEREIEKGGRLDED